MSETANESRKRRIASGQGMLVATESFEAAGARFVRGEDRIAFGHALLQNPDIRRGFVACESPAGRAVIRGGRTPWRLRNRRGDRPQWWIQSEEVR
jgi:hypothetical protein